MPAQTKVAPLHAVDGDADITQDFIERLPKTDLHVHLDGSVRISTLIDLAREYHVELPSYTEEGLRETVLKDRYRNLSEYLQGFAYTGGHYHANWENNDARALVLNAIEWVAVRP